MKQIKITFIIIPLTVIIIAMVWCLYIGVLKKIMQNIKHNNILAFLTSSCKAFNKIPSAPAQCKDNILY